MPAGCGHFYLILLLNLLTMINEQTKIHAMPLNIADEKKKLQGDLREWFDSIRTLLNEIPKDLDEQIELLALIRQKGYEELNQLQHARLIIKVAEFLQKKYKQNITWFWHPKQTSHPDFADLTGYLNEEVLIYAEVTTSQSPVGTIDQRMRTTLETLNKKSGNKYYVVLTEEMRKRASTKINKLNIDVQVINITQLNEEYTDEFKAELDHRYEEYRKDGVTIPWEVVKESIQKRIRK